MRTFHTGGVAGDDITQVFHWSRSRLRPESRKGLVVISEIKGTVKINDVKKKRK